MEEIFTVISEKPEYFAWTFGLVNALWMGFVYFNKKRHEKELIGVKQSFDLDLERRKKVFEMKFGEKRPELIDLNIKAFEAGMK